MKKRTKYISTLSKRQAEEFSLTYSELLRAKKYFHTQLAHAHKRHIDFDMSFEDWAKWWEDQLGKDWLYKRGRGAGKFHMARKNDKGSYSLNNIKCITHEQNGHDRAKNKTASSGHKHATRVVLTKTAVLDIFTSKDTNVYLGKKYNVNESTISAIRNKRSWNWLTKGISK